MTQYHNPDIIITEGVRGFCGERHFTIELESDPHGDEPLDVVLHIDEQYFRDLVAVLKDVWEKGE